MSNHAFASLNHPEMNHFLMIRKTFKKFKQTPDFFFQYGRFVAPINRLVAQQFDIYLWLLLLIYMANTRDPVKIKYI